MNRNIADLIFNVLMYAELAIGIGVFILLFFISAPYGRHYRKGWGFTVSERFSWIFMESPAFILIPLFFMLGIKHMGIVSLIFVLIWELHYLQRTIIYPLLFPRARKVFPLLLTFMAFFFNMLNGIVQGYGLFIIAPPYALSWLADPRLLQASSFL
jgi:3-oxo-5-alpha-steroid 4-dehydrogenase 1